jgi:hypothetical protein
VVIQTEGFEKWLHFLHQLCNTYNLKTSLKETKNMAFWGSHPVRKKMVTEGYIVEQMSCTNFIFLYIHCLIL